MMRTDNWLVMQWEAHSLEEEEEGPEFAAHWLFAGHRTVW
jgi:hypothetical protein